MVTTLTVASLGGGAFRLDWASDLAAPTFYVYRDGVLATTTTRTSLVVGAADGESPLYEVLDDAAAVPGAAYPAYALLAWYASAGAAGYRVEELDLPTGLWTERTSFTDEGGNYYVYRSRYLEDATTHRFRVTPLGANGNAGTPADFVVLMVRVPDAPAASFTYNGAGTPTVTVAAA